MYLRCTWFALWFCACVGCLNIIDDLKDSDGESDNDFTDFNFSDSETSSGSDVEENF